MKKNNPLFSNKLAVDFVKLAELMPGHVYWKDRNGLIMGCNDGQAKSLGLRSKEELIGRTVYDLTWHKLQDSERVTLAELHANLDNNVMTSGVAYIREALITTIEGSKKYLINKVPLKNTQNEIIGLISMATEVSSSETLEKELPRKKATSSKNAQTQQQMPVVHSDNPPLKILLIEDNQIASKTAKKLLESFYHKVETAYDAIEALSCFKLRKYDIIFTNVGLPDLDGYKLTEQFRRLEADEKADPTPIIALTAHESTHISKKAAASGMNGISTTPLSQANAIKAIRQFVYDKKMVHKSSSKSTTVTKKPTNRFMKKSIDLEEGAKILGKDYVAAEEMLYELMESLREVRSDIEKAYRADNLGKLGDAVHKFYGGLCYVGVPHLRQATKELENALVKKDKNQLNRLYQRMLDEMSAVEREFSSFKEG